MASAAFSPTALGFQSLSHRRRQYRLHNRDVGPMAAGSGSGAAGGGEARREKKTAMKKFLLCAGSAGPLSFSLSAQATGTSLKLWASVAAKTLWSTKRGNKAREQGPLHAGALQTFLREGPTTRQRPQNRGPFHSPVFFLLLPAFPLSTRESWAVRRARATLGPVWRARCPRAFLFFFFFVLAVSYGCTFGACAGRERREGGMHSRPSSCLRKSCCVEGLGLDKTHSFFFLRFLAAIQR